MSKSVIEGIKTPLTREDLIKEIETYIETLDSVEDLPVFNQDIIKVVLGGFAIWLKR